MAIGELRVSQENQTTVFYVHHWPATNHLPSTCGSRCADREGANLTPEWLKSGDQDAISLRLISGGKDKGRVLYCLDRKLGGLRRVLACVLLHRETASRYQLTRICLSGKVLEAERQHGLSELVLAAKAIALAGGARLEMLVPPNAQPGDICDAYDFDGTFKDARGRVWAR